MSSNSASVEQERPAVSVILPFAGSAEEAESAVRMLKGLELGPDDEILLVDNSGQEGLVRALEPIQVIKAWDQPSSYYARNEGATRATSEWLLFTDADCRPAPGLIDRYFATPIDADVGAVIGEVEGTPDQTALVSRYARSRKHLGQEVHWHSPFRPWGVTANILVRREAWASVGGFQEGIRSAGDTEFSWRLQDAGWKLDFRPDAVVQHEHRESIRRLARQAARYGAGRAWIMRRYPTSFGPPVLVRRLARCAAGVVVWSMTGRFERAVFKALDAVYVVSEWSAFWLMPNRGDPAVTARQARVALAADAFPSLGTVGDDRVRGAHIEVRARPVRIDWRRARDLDLSYIEDDGGLDRIQALLWLLLHAPAAATSKLRRSPKEVLAIAPAVRRVHMSGASEVDALDEASADRAACISDLLLAVRR